MWLPSWRCPERGSRVVQLYHAHKEAPPPEDHQRTIGMVLAPREGRRRAPCGEGRQCPPNRSIRGDRPLVMTSMKEALMDSGCVGSTEDHTLVGTFWEVYHENRRCSRDTYPVSCITMYTRVRKKVLPFRILATKITAQMLHHSIHFARKWIEKGCTGRFPASPSQPPNPKPEPSNS